MSPDASEKRHGYRFLAGLKAAVTIESNEMDCQAVDLHRAGVLLEGEFEVEPHTRVRISLTSTSEDLRFQAHGRIMHVSANEQTGATQLGVQFESIDSDQRETLELLVARVVEGMSPAPLAHLARDASVEEIRDALSKIPTAHKITFAQRALPLERGFLFHDDSRHVTEALCRNPQLTLPEAIKILRLPTLLPTTLELLSRDSRWNANEEIKIMIATHPRVTYPVADRLVQTLSLPGIRKVIRRPGLNPAIREKLVQSVPHKQLQGW